MANSESDQVRLGTVYGTSAYLLWGAMPLYFALLVPASPVEIIAHRVLWSLLVCGLITLAGAALLARRTGAGFHPLREFLALGRRRFLLLGLAGGLIFVNWLVYVIAVATGHVVEAALGYFINPILSVVLGVLVLRERLTVARWIAVGISLVAVLVLAIGYGRPPWLSLVLATSFGLYGLIKTRLKVAAVTSLTVETLWLTPVAIIVLVVLGPANTFLGHGTTHALLLASAGLVTTVPLLLFNAGARRIPLSLTGLLQNLTPVLQFIVGITIFGEHMPAVRWIGFGLVWLALLVLMADLVVRSRRRLSRPE